MPRDAPSSGGAVPAEAEQKAQAKPATEVDRLAALEAQTKRAAWEGMQRAKDLKRQREELAKERSATTTERAELEAWKKEREDRKRNPAKYLAAEYGPDWYDKLSQVRLTGAAPADLVASEVDDRVAQLRKEMDERDAKWAKRFEEQEAKQAAQMKAEHEATAGDYLKANAEKFPLIHAFEVQGNINAVIEAHFVNTAKRGADGELEPGELLSAEQAAQMMESHLQARVDGIEKAKQAKAKAVPPTQAAVPAAQRRTLSTDMTGTSEGEGAPPKDDGERMRRALAAWNRVESSRQAN